MDIKKVIFKLDVDIIIKITKIKVLQVLKIAKISPMPDPNKVMFIN